ncbi:phosphoglycerate dehydrogenase-like oxidoreductase [Metallosphaera yellowstonensis MK1]|uniref:Phosphoglycerate dehydrogenase-like oxidoreductase n=1 Tax=Metallosphaera yellowstonensis MK1 TaxID=671065 RepID=H2C1V9_9CREN|nr:hydroxyacid dehydrogenase [Metallosphaera yellowstonensis]EHP70230.1 phosphoglycerate dehydrogenase-like oxidoreductase [Metallosphaera yellowstonensis MK1]
MVFSNPPQERPKVIVESNITNSTSPRVNQVLEELYGIARVVKLDHSSPKEVWIREIDDVVAVVNRKAKLDKEIIAAAKKLRLIARTGSGVDKTRIDLEEAKKKGIIITYNPGLNSPSVSELTFLLIQAIYRKLFKVTQLVKEGRWNEGVNLPGMELSGKTLGIVGLGNIGRRVARIGTAYEMRVLGYDPYVRDKIQGIEIVELEDLLRESDIITLHVPLTEETRGLIDRKRLSLVKDGAVLINASRGEIVDEGALVDALRSGKLMGAGLDVLNVEPPSPDNPLLQMENVIITPHIGGTTIEAFERGAESAIREVIRLLKGEPLKNIFNY